MCTKRHIVKKKNDHTHNCRSQPIRVCCTTTTTVVFECVSVEYYDSRVLQKYIPDLCLTCFDRLKTKGKEKRRSEQQKQKMSSLGVSWETASVEWTSPPSESSRYNTMKASVKDMIPVNECHGSAPVSSIPCLSTDDMKIGQDQARPSQLHHYLNELHRPHHLNSTSQQRDDVKLFQERNLELQGTLLALLFFTMLFLIGTVLMLLLSGSTGTTSPHEHEGSLEESKASSGEGSDKQEESVISRQFPDQFSDVVILNGSTTLDMMQPTTSPSAPSATTTITTTAKTGATFHGAITICSIIGISLILEFIVALHFLQDLQE